MDNNQLFEPTVAQPVDNTVPLFTQTAAGIPLEPTMLQTAENTVPLYAQTGAGMPPGATAANVPPNAAAMNWTTGMPPGATTANVPPNAAAMNWTTGMPAGGTRANVPPNATTPNATAAKKGTRLAGLGLGAKIAIVAACVIVAAGIVFGTVLAVQAWNNPAADDKVTQEEFARVVAENKALKKKAAEKTGTNEDPLLESGAPMSEQPPNGSDTPAMTKPDMTYPIPDNGDSPDKNTDDGGTPEAAVPVLPTNPQTPDTPYNSQRVLVWNNVNGWILEFEEWLDGEWTTMLQTTAYIGRNGTSTNTREGDRKTPAGTFNILFCFGITEPRTDLRFRRITSSDVFVDDTDSPYYNTIVSSSNIGSGTSHEKVYDQFSNGSYTTCIFFDFNGDGEIANTSTSGRGSVRTLRGKSKNLRDTLGDIDISSEDMTTLLTLLDSAKHPIIIIG